MATSNPAYTRNLKEMPLADLLRRADDVRALHNHPGWSFVLDAIESWKDLQIQRLLNETTKEEDVSRLRGLILGLASAPEAAASIVAYAEDAEAKANQRIAQEHVNV